MNNSLIPSHRKRSLFYILAVLGIGCAVLMSGFAISTQQPLFANADAGDKPLRLHILANSDSPVDQQLKLALRDYIIDSIGELTANAADKDEAMQLIADHLTEIETSCRCFLSGGEKAQNGSAESSAADRQISVTLQRDDFPAIDYAGIVLAAGEYDALRIVIGAGAGHNWWCVLFPPLCFADLATEPDPEATAAALAEMDSQSSNSVSYRIELKMGNILRRHRRASGS